MFARIRIVVSLFILAYSVFRIATLSRVVVHINLQSLLLGSIISIIAGVLVVIVATYYYRTKVLPYVDESPK